MTGLAISDEHRRAGGHRRPLARGPRRPRLGAGRARDAGRRAARRGGPSWPASGWAGLAVAEDARRPGLRGGRARGRARADRGRAACPGRCCPTAIVATALDRWGDGRRRWSTALVDGGVAGLALDSTMTAAGGDDLVVSGRAAEAWSATVADVVLVPVDVDGARTWCLLDRLGRRGPRATQLRPDATGGRGRRVDGVAVPRSRQLSIAAEVDALAGVLAAAEGARASRSGASTPPPSTPAPACSSAGRSASSRR